MCEGYQIRFDVAFKKENDTVITILKPVITKCPEDPGPIIAGVFLSIIFLGAFLLNLMVVVTVATSYTLKRFLYCHLLINLSLSCMIDCFLNLSIAIGYVTTAPWRFGYGVSYFNGFTINMMNSEMAFAVLLLAVDRLAAAKKYTSYLNSEKYKLGVVIGVTWVVAFILASPLVCGFVLSMPYKNRYSCSVADPRDDYYLITHLLLIVCLPTLVMVVLVCVISVTFHRERKKQKRIKGNQTMSYFDQILMTPYFRNEFYPSVFVICAVIAYVMLWLPFTGLTTISPMMTKHWANETTEDSPDDDFSRFLPTTRSNFRVSRAMVDATQLEALNSTNATLPSDMTPDMTNITMDEGFIPEIVDTPAFDTVAVWFRFIFNIVVPILVFITLREVRTKCEALIMCCRPNSVDVASPKPSRPPYISSLPGTGTAEKKAGDTKSQKKQKKDNKNTINCKTPILFSTSEGLHIRTIGDTYLDMKENRSLLPFNRQNNDQPKFVYNLCDVMLGYEDLTDFDGQFHIDDSYDFEGDPEAENLGKGNAVVIGAQRAALGQKGQGPAESNDEEEGTNFNIDYRPPTPPKVQVVGNDSAVNFGNALEAEDVNKHKKGKKVRFATLLNEEIPRPRSAESSILNSSANSSRSTDSGIMADNERNSAQQDNENRKPRLNVNNRQQAAKKQTNKPGVKARATRKPPPPKKVGAPSSKIPSGPKTPKKVVSSKIRNIKSRHMNNLNSSLTSLENKSPTRARRFSKAST
ncbi:uncharacterized protein LOC121860358 [Homarus americanus]|uniref:uncharacterized protein LOC121860357 n=1 Tax=Homarus americanus TaxID=6706 RepID=UPI001C474E92|nr:uncharacterized protein LOC121860357 [Homarus americanus]XP_042213390.1 uncharacterized protein LOC121860358 [Homarus americanus]